MIGDKIVGICIKSYQHEDDIIYYEEGSIAKNDIKTYIVGGEYMIVDGMYNKAFWKPKERIIKD